MNHLIKMCVTLISLGMLFMPTACGASPEPRLAGERTGSAARKTQFESDREPYLNSTFYRKHMPSGTTEAFYDCMDATGNTNSGKAECIDDEAARQDKRLNDFYRALLSRLKEQNKKQVLIDTQRKWIESRTKDVGFESFIYGKERIEEIESALSDLVRLTQRADLIYTWGGTVDI